MCFRESLLVKPSSLNLVVSVVFTTSCVSKDKLGWIIPLVVDVDSHGISTILYLKACVYIFEYNSSVFRYILVYLMNDNTSTRVSVFFLDSILNVAGNGIICLVVNICDSRFGGESVG